MGKSNPKVSARLRRKMRIRKRLKGDAERPRLSVFRSAKHIYAQIIDDERGVTLMSASSLAKEIRDRIGDFEDKKSIAKEVGKLIAAKAKAHGIEKLAFDRGGYRYHGRVKALADGVREAGIQV